ncbi:MAG: alpha-glucan family phosphorylase [Candidatus Omnitrophota bacterium]
MKKSSSKKQSSYSYQDFAGLIDRFDSVYKSDIDEQKYFGFPLDPILKIENQLLGGQAKTIAYFSMEFGIAPSIYNSFGLSRPMSEKNKFFKHEVFSNYWLSDYVFKIQIDKMLDIPIYSGGLGVLAGDSMKSIADLGLPVTGIGILWNKGYFKQNFWYKHGQVPEELTWDPHTYPGLIPLKNIVTIETKQGPLNLKLWKYYVYSYDKKNACPIILLDSNLPENSEPFRKLTDQLYRSDDMWWKIFQRAILGIGGVKALDSLGYNIGTYHLNEGHAAFAIIEKYLSLDDKSEMKDLMKHFVYTCHTPVVAGHDRFKVSELRNIFDERYVRAAEEFGKENAQSPEINLTFMALNHCNKVNAVAKKHGEVMRIQFPDFAKKVQSITNGVHTHTWVSESFAKLFDKYEKILGDWRADPTLLSRITALAESKAFRRDLFEAHQENKRNLINVVKHWQLKEDIFTLSWARRIAGYKRPALIFHDTQRLVDIARRVGPMQIILAGKAHPNDNLGAAHIEDILDHIDALNDYSDVVKVLILENYDTYFGKLLSNSVDVWLNNPLPPFEASGTSGMKAILNGVLQMSTVDGWVVEAVSDDIGWLFGYRHKGSDIGNENDLRLDEDSKALCDTLEEAVGLYYKTCKSGKIVTESPWIDKMIHCIEKSGFFNTQRMIGQYKSQMWE